ncbi:hypothetical protein [Roseateles microcysteis]|uniref:hypothetical protein n=1 Tax=Roseateles microcysteis TaxID=3119057 RepID=UPI002FE526F1
MRRGFASLALVSAMLAAPQLGQQSAMRMLPGSGISYRSKPKPKRKPAYSAERIQTAEAKRQRKNAKRLRDFAASEAGYHWWAQKFECGRRPGGYRCRLPKGTRCPDCSSAGLC